MKKIISILFLSVYLLSATEIGQLLKLPELVSHYAEHKEQNQQMSIWDFLYMHYINDFKKDADYAKDMKLPFKASENTAHLMSSVCPTSLEITHITPVAYSARIKKPLIDHPEFSNQYLAAIWQPPRGC